MNANLIKHTNPQTAEITITGTPDELERATQWIQSDFKVLGIAPVGEQSIKFTVTPLPRPEPTNMKGWNAAKINATYDAINKALADGTVLEAFWVAEEGTTYIGNRKLGYVEASVLIGTAP